MDKIDENGLILARKVLKLDEEEVFSPSQSPFLLENLQTPEVATTYQNPNALISPYASLEAINEPIRTQGLTHEEKMRYKALLERKIQLGEDLPHIHKFKYYAWQRKFFNSRSNMIFLNASNQAVFDGEEIPTPLGFRRIKDIRVGDKIFGRDGKECEVETIPYKGTALCYRVTFDDGADVIVSSNHLWKVRFPFVGKARSKPHVVTTEEIIKVGRYAPDTEPRLRAQCDICEEVEYSSPLEEPYLVGFWVGDGTVQGNTAQLHKLSYDTEELFMGTHDFVMGQDKRSVRSKKLGALIRKLYPNEEMVSQTKHLPESYLTGAKVDRVALLRGLMDSDGYASSKGNEVSFTTTSEKLRDQFVELVSSLGCVVNRVATKKTHYTKGGERVVCSDAYTVVFKSTFNPFRLKRKADRWRFLDKYRHTRIVYKIEEVGHLPCTCFTVTSQDSQFLVTRRYIVTHNSGKSLIQTRKMIEWCGNRTVWPELWPRSDMFQHWYFYPNYDTIVREFETKWKKLMPGPRLQNDARSTWRWKEIKEKGKLIGISWGYGTQTFPMYFLSYSQDLSGQQASSVNYIALDEEAPVFRFPEYQVRLRATHGYFSMVFTATLGQDEWRRTMEPEEDEEELFPLAEKSQISMYDCMTFDDGTPGMFTEEDIKQEIAKCIDENEVRRRVFGRFVPSGKLYVPNYQTKKHLRKPHIIPSSWRVYSGIDSGSGGDKAHPAAMVFLAVSPDYTTGRFFIGWKGDKKMKTTSGDILQKHKSLIEEHKLKITSTVYDYGDADLAILAERDGGYFIKADKSRDKGWQTMDTLFGVGALAIYATPELRELGVELSRLTRKEDGTERRGSNKVKDDLADAARYVVMSVPWDWKKILASSKLKEPVDELPDYSKKPVDEEPFYGIVDDPVVTDRPKREDNFQKYLDARPSARAAYEMNKENRNGESWEDEAEEFYGYV